MGQQAHVSPQMHSIRTLSCLLLLQHMMVIAEAIFPPL